MNVNDLRIILHRGSPKVEWLCDIAMGLNGGLSNLPFLHGYATWPNLTYISYIQFIHNLHKVNNV